MYPPVLTKYWIFFFLRKKYDLNIDIKKKIKINGILKILFEIFGVSIISNGYLFWSIYLAPLLSETKYISKFSL